MLHTQHDLWYGSSSSGGSSHDRRQMCLSGGADCARGRLPGQSRARQGKECDRKSAELPKGERAQRRGVHITKRGASVRQQPLLDVSTRITTTDNRGSLAAGRYHVIIGTSPVTPHHRGLIRLAVAISSSLRRLKSSAMHACTRDS